MPDPAAPLPRPRSQIPLAFLLLALTASLAANLLLWRELYAYKRQSSKITLFLNEQLAAAREHQIDLETIRQQQVDQAAAANRLINASKDISKELDDSVADNERLRADNAKLHAEITALKSRPPAVIVRTGGNP